MTNPAPDIAIIGGGPGGYVAALRAARRGATVTLVEEREVGGVCLNRGCIPTKTLLRSAEVFSTVKRAAEYGVTLPGSPGVDYPRVFERKERVVRQLRKGVEGLLRSARVELVQGRAVLEGPQTVKVTSSDGRTQALSPRHIILATGSSPAVLPLGAEGAVLWTSDDLLAAGELPQSLAIIGGGVIGVEFASLCARLGVKVTVLELMAQLLPGEDPDLAKALQQSLARDGVKVHTSAAVRAVRPAPGGMAVEAEVQGQPLAVTAERVLVAVGRRPNTEGLGLEQAGVAVSGRGFIEVNDQLQTSVPGVYAIGDVTGRWPLAHVASVQGIVAVDNAIGQARRMDYRAIPRCLYTAPEAAAVGLTETQAREKGLDAAAATFPFAASGKALTAGDREGFVKVVYGQRYGDILGMHIVGPHATELIAEAVLAIQAEYTVEDLEQVVHAHPTLSEALMEAAHAAGGYPIHVS